MSCWHQDSIPVVKKRRVPVKMPPRPTLCLTSAIQNQLCSDRAYPALCFTLHGNYSSACSMLTAQASTWHLPSSCPLALSAIASHSMLMQVWSPTAAPKPKPSGLKPGLAAFSKALFFLVTLLQVVPRISIPTLFTEEYRSLPGALK